MEIAITCIADDLLRGVVSLGARHAGYRVIDTETVSDAIAKAKRTRPDVMLIGILADPDGELVRWCTAAGIWQRVVSPQVTVAELGIMLDQVRQNRSADKPGQ